MSMAPSDHGDDDTGGLSDFADTPSKTPPPMRMDDSVEERLNETVVSRQ